MKSGDLVFRESYSIFLYENSKLSTPSPILMEQKKTIAIVLEVIPAKSSLKGTLISPEKVKLLHPSGRSGWGYSEHYSVMSCQ